MAATLFQLSFSVLLQEAMDIKLEDYMVMLRWYVSFGCVSSSFYFPDYLSLRIQQWGGECTLTCQLEKRFGLRALPNKIFSLTPGLDSSVWANHPFPRNGPNFWHSPPTLFPLPSTLSSKQPSPSYHSFTSISLELSFKLPFDPGFLALCLWVSVGLQY